MVGASGGVQEKWRPDLGPWRGFRCVDIGSAVPPALIGVSLGDLPPCVSPAPLGKAKGNRLVLTAPGQWAAGGHPGLDATTEALCLSAPHPREAALM